MNKKKEIIEYAIVRGAKIILEKEHYTKLQYREDCTINVSDKIIVMSFDINPLYLVSSLDGMRQGFDKYWETERELNTLEKRMVIFTLIQKGILNKSSMKLSSIFTILSDNKTLRIIINGRNILDIPYTIDENGKYVVYTKNKNSETKCNLFDTTSLLSYGVSDYADFNDHKELYDTSINSMIRQEVNPLSQLTIDTDKKINDYFGENETLYPNVNIGYEIIDPGITLGTMLLKNIKKPDIHDEFTVLGNLKDKFTRLDNILIERKSLNKLISDLKEIGFIIKQKNIDISVLEFGKSKIRIVINTLKSKVYVQAGDLGKNIPLDFNKDIISSITTCITKILIQNK